MVKESVKQEYKKDDTTRRVSYKIRVKDIVKKTQELSLLYGLDACTVIYGPYDQAPVVFPPVDAKARRLLSEFQRLQQAIQVAKAEEELLKLQQKNRPMQMENLMAELFNRKPLEEVAVTDLHDLLLVVYDKISRVRHRLRELEGDNKNNPNPQVNVGSNVVDSLPNQHPGKEIVRKGPQEMQAGPSHQPMDDGNGSNIV